MLCEQKQTQNPKKVIKKKICLKLNKKLKWTTKNMQTVNFIILKSKKRERKASRHGRHFDKVEASGDAGYEKLVPVVLIFVIKSAI